MGAGAGTNCRLRPGTCRPTAELMPCAGRRTRLLRTRRPWPARSVNDARILTPWRRLNCDPLVVVCRLVVAGGGRGDAAEVSVFEPVGVAFEGDDVGVVDEAVDHGGGHD